MPHWPIVAAKAGWQQSDKRNHEDFAQWCWARNRSGQSIEEPLAPAVFHLSLLGYSMPLSICDHSHTMLILSLVLTVIAMLLALLKKTRPSVYCMFVAVLLQAVIALYPMCNE